MSVMRTKLKRDDTVKVLTGKEKGKTGKILRIDHAKNRAIVQGLNMVKKAVRPKSQQDKGGIIEVEAPIELSNLAFVGKGGQTTRLGYRFEGGKKIRYAKKSGDAV
ncbi:50S ribosomal protein L24 [Sediminispirochaeta bajacaliforniensis]|uniref:50S ribosomal protein L24 n=1 Tax=Sediminispirochaeta bajacaliforniensis TaxID=148 RepID=UPI00035C8261|nr:50S ribosomal protein L24 [Sediminispirochaeta bajacaliforniensis]